MSHIVFMDLDGTIEDSRQDMAESANRVRAEFGLSPRAIELLKTCVNKGMDELYRTCFDDFLNAQTQETYADAYAKVRVAYETYYLKNVTVHTKAYDGMVDAIRKISGIAKMVLVTNKPTHISQKLLENLGVCECFSILMGGDSCPENKPSPLPLRIASRKLNFDSGHFRSVMVGDTLADVKAGHAFGARTVWCAWGYLAELKEAKADYTAQKPDGLFEIVQKILV